MTSASRCAPPTRDLADVHTHTHIRSYLRVAYQTFHRGLFYVRLSSDVSRPCHVPCTQRLSSSGHTLTSVMSDLSTQKSLPPVASSWPTIPAIAIIAARPLFSSFVCISLNSAALAGLNPAGSNPKSPGEWPARTNEQWGRRAFAENRAVTRSDRAVFDRLPSHSS